MEKKSPYLSSPLLTRWRRPGPGSLTGCGPTLGLLLVCCFFFFSKCVMRTRRRNSLTLLSV